MQRNYGKSLLKAKIRFLVKKCKPGVWLPTMTWPVKNLLSDHPGRLLSIELLSSYINLKEALMTNLLIGGCSLTALGRLVPGKSQY